MNVSSNDAFTLYFLGSTWKTWCSRRSRTCWCRGKYYDATFHLTEAHCSIISKLNLCKALSKNPCMDRWGRGAGTRILQWMEASIGQFCASLWKGYIFVNIFTPEKRKKTYLKFWGFFRNFLKLYLATLEPIGFYPYRYEYYLTNT